MNRQAKFIHPHDTPISSGLRFAVELIAWISGPWLASYWGALSAVIVLAVLVGLPSIFSTLGDKNTIIVATPGPVRVAIEISQYAVALCVPWIIWPAPAAIGCSMLVLASIGFGWPRLWWLIQGADTTLHS
jgi:hypothetical protein